MTMSSEGVINIDGVTSDKLMPCPFCGHEVEETCRDVQVMWAPPGTVRREYKAECPECGCWMEKFARKELRENWNGLTRLDMCPICHNYVNSKMKDFPRSYHGYGGGQYIQCVHCGLTTRVFSDDLEATDFWNRRVR